MTSANSRCSYSAKEDVRAKCHLTRRRLDCHSAEVNVYFAKRPSVESQIVESEISLVHGTTPTPPCGRVHTNRG